MVELERAGGPHSSFSELELTNLDYFEELLRSWNSSASRWCVGVSSVREQKKRYATYDVLCHTIAPDRLLDSAIFLKMKQFSAMNKLKKMALRMLSFVLGEAKVACLIMEYKLTLYFFKCSTSTGFNDMRIVEHCCLTSYLRSPELAQVVSANIDNSGTIDYWEFLVAIVHLNKMEREENLVPAFSFFDKEASGYITIDELQEACKRFGLSDLHLNEMIREFFLRKMLFFID
ncbi:hypothetical protein H6P81_018089 [Aristolochia fimbriata]|uniref:EF-hand domain-containing protein n=1 Tax=Aristolochia fimbriata TaxID=158543 RepID=A0AAV7E009_ARIFI|nr:hypothetical protein H6P81_018089 [Aristolochia fimbriata]